MYCTACDCYYEGWTRRCPVCKQTLQEFDSQEKIQDTRTVNYVDLVDLVRANGGSLSIPVSASHVIRKKSTRFPWLGFGFAWTQKMNGKKDGISVELITREVGKSRRTSFPYRGHGYAWRKEMEGTIGGNNLRLQAMNVKRKKTWTFPYSGYGYAWTEDMAGDCGNQIRVELSEPKVFRYRRWRFPYFGYGYAWVTESTLTLNLN
jgi:hypothetical protein